MVQLLTRPVAALVATTMAFAAFTTVPLARPSAGGAASAAAPAEAVRASEQQARRAFATMPLAFEANRGQSDPRVRYLARGAGFTLFLTQRRAVFGFRGAAVALKPVGADRRPRLVGRTRRAATSSYFRGTDPSKWQRGAPTFGRVRYEGLYDGIDMVFHGNRAGAEYDFVVAPGAEPSQIGYRLRARRACGSRAGIWSPPLRPVTSCTTLLSPTSGSTGSAGASTPGSCSRTGWSASSSAPTTRASRW